MTKFPTNEVNAGPASGTPPKIGESIVPSNGEKSICVRDAEDNLYWFNFTKAMRSLSSSSEFMYILGLETMERCRY